MRESINKYLIIRIQRKLLSFFKYKSKDKDMNKIKKWEQNQVELFKQINQLHINIITCSDCSCVILHRRDDKAIYCPDCDASSSSNEHPDLFFY